MAILAACLPAAMPAQAANRLTNGSFENWREDVPVGWRWYVKHGYPPDLENPTPVGIDKVDDQAYTGDRCIRFWKKNPIERERYGMLFQDVKGLPAGAKLHLRAMVKGKDVGRTYWCDWKHIVVGPIGDFDWRRLSATIQLGPDQTDIRFMIAMDAASESMWVDDLQLIVDGEEFDATVKSEKAKAKARTTAKPEYITGGSFEYVGHAFYSRPFDPWKMWHKGNAKVTFMRDAGESAHGVYSIRMSKDTPVAHDSYGMLDQKIAGLPPGATIHYSAMMKGQGVKQVWLGDWVSRTRPPDGDFGWQRFEGKAKLADGQTGYILRIGVEGKTDALWVDDVHVWVDGPSPQERVEQLFIRRMQPWARPGVSTIKGTKQFPEDKTGFQVVVRNPESDTRTFALNWTLCDALGAPLRSDSANIELSPLEQKRVTVPVELKGRRVASMLATLSDEAGEELADAIDFVTAPPASLAPISLSGRFGANAFPFLWSQETNRLALDQMAAGGYGDWSYRQMDRSFDHQNKKLNPEAYKWFFSEARARGISILPNLGFAPQWASTAPAGASANEKRMLLPQLEVWADLVKQYVQAHQFKAVEVWNEPDGSAPLGYPKHEAYAKLLNATYDAVKSVDSHIIVVGCSTQGEGTGWPESVLKAGGRMDAISFHPYRCYVLNSHRAPSIEKRLGERGSYPDMIESLNTMSARYNDGKPLPLYATEIGFVERYHDGTPSIHGMHLYKTQYVIRSFLTLAGLGVENTSVFVYGMPHGDSRFDVGQRPDFSLRPDWWATRTMQEVAATREIGEFTPLTDDIFTLPMKGERDAVAVWTAEDATIVGTATPLSEVRDIFGRTAPSLSTRTGKAYVIPAGSVIYMIGAGKLTAADIEPLVRLRPDTWKVAPGGNVEYAVETAPAVAKYFSGSLSKTVSADLDSSMVRWAVGAAPLPVGDEIARVPVMVPVKSKFVVSLEFNEHCYPEVRIENNRPEAVDTVIEISAGGRGSRTKPRVAGGAIHRETLAMLPKDPATPLNVHADIVAGEKTRIAKQLYYARVSRAAIEVNGKTTDWRDVDCIALSEWFKNAAEKPAEPKDLSASMAMAYDARSFYLLVEVTDDIHYEPFAAGQAWMGDSIQLAFDTNPTGEHTRAEMDFALTDSGDEIESLRPLNTIDSAEVRYRIRRDGNQTIYEIAFPLSALHVKGRGSGTRLGFSLLVNENDTGAREGYLRWSDGIGNGKYPEKYGQLLFGD